MRMEPQLFFNLTTDQTSGLVSETRGMKWLFGYVFGRSDRSQLIGCRVRQAQLPVRDKEPCSTQQCKLAAPYLSTEGWQYLKLTHDRWSQTHNG